MARGPIDWRFSFGACLLTAAALLPHAPLAPVLAGMGLAAVVQYGWSRLPRGRDRRQ